MASIPILQEHQAPLEGDPDRDSPKDERSKEEKQTVKLVHKLLTEAKDARQVFDSEWLTYWRFFRGKQWEEKRPSYRHSEVINLIWSHIQSVHALLTDPRPNIEVIPEEPSDFEFSEIVTQVLRANWANKNFQFVLAEACLDALIMGTAIAEVPWNKEEHDGLGDYGFETVDPLYFYPDPECQGKINDRKRSRYAIKAVPTDIEIVRGEYPEHAKKIKPDLTDLSLAKSTKDDLDSVKLVSPIDRNLALQEKEDYEQKTGQKKVLKITCYLRDEEKIEDVKTGEDGQEIKFLRKKYPNGRKIVIADGYVLEDVPNEDEEGDFPFGRFVDYLLPRQMWGEGEVEQLKSPQKIVNKTGSYMLDVMKIMGNPIWVIDSNSGVDPDTLANKPGLVVEKVANTEVRREEGVNLPPFIMNLFEMFKGPVFDRIGGLGEASQGQAPGGVSAAFAIDLLQEASQTKIRAKARNLDAFLQEVGLLMLNRVTQKYTVPRVIRITNNENAANYFKFAMDVTKDPVTGEIKRMATVSPFKPDGNGGVLEGESKQFAVKSKFDLRVNTGTSLPFAKAKKANIARQLYVDQVIDGEDYLNAIDWPNKEQAIEKWKQRQMAQAQAAAMGGGGPAPANPAPASPIV